MHAIEEGSEARPVRSAVKSVSDHPIYSPPMVLVHVHVLSLYGNKSRIIRRGFDTNEFNWGVY